MTKRQTKKVVSNERDTYFYVVLPEMDNIQQNQKLKKTLGQLQVK